MDKTETWNDTPKGLKALIEIWVDNGPHVCASRIPANVDNLNFLLGACWL